MRKINFNLNDSTLNNFGVKRKRLVSSYTSTTDSIRAIRKKDYSSGATALTDLTRYTSGDMLDPYFTSPGKNNDQVAVLSTSLYQTNLIYQKIIDYYRNMYYWRYVVTPRRLQLDEDSKKLNKKEFGKLYHNMLEIVDGISIETTFPRLLLEIFKNGQLYLYARGDQVSRTVSTIVLPAKYCRPGLKTQHGTVEIDFDFSYFDSLGLNQEEKVALLAVFPKEFVRCYDEFLADKTNKRWQTLDPKVSTCIRMNEAGFPSFLSLFYDIIDYKTYKLNELDKSTNKLERLVTQEIDLEKSGLELPEVEQLHASMADIICQNKGSTLVTSVGTINVHPLQEDDSVQNEALNQAYNNIYNNAGINYNLFNGSIAESLDASIKRDLAFVWVYIEQLVNFYNLAINNLVNFKGYQLSLRVLPISPYNESEKLSSFHQNAEYGVGIMDLVVASGIKQVDLESTLEMEEYLDLSNRLVPLSSSHTLSSTDVQEKKSGKDNKSTDPSDIEKTSQDNNEEANGDEDESKDSNIKK